MGRAMAKDVVRVAAVGDLHCTRTSQGAFQPLFSQIAEAADLLLLAGDLTDYGLPEEARVLAHELATLRVPTVAVLGNHDFESGQQDEVRQILIDAGVTVLDGDACEVLGIGIAGVKGFGGGFGQRALGPWGEPIIKQFVHEAVNEALKLEAALARLRTPPDRRAPALLADTADGRRRAARDLSVRRIQPARGADQPLPGVRSCSTATRIAASSKGATERNVPVYNVSMPLLTRTFPDRPAVPRLRRFPLTDRAPPDRQRLERAHGNL